MGRPRPLSGDFPRIGIGITMWAMTLLFENLWDQYMAWSVLVSVIAFGWLYHHSFWFVSDEAHRRIYDVAESDLPELLYDLVRRPWW